MINILLTRILILFLVIYMVNRIYKKFVKGQSTSKNSTSSRVREYTDYHKKEWENIKKSLQE